MNDNMYWRNYWKQQQESVPWEINKVDSVLVDFVSKNNFSKVLEIGCGGGSNSIWMSEQGLDVTSIDVSDFAIDLAQKRDIKSEVNFLEQDFFSFYSEEKFDFIFDRGCYHGFSNIVDRHKFVKKVNSLLSENGFWLSMIGSAENVNFNIGPPRHTLLETVSCIEPYMKIVEVGECELENQNGTMSPSWKIVSKVRVLPVSK